MCLVSFECRSKLKTQTARTVTSTTAKVGPAATLRMHWGLTTGPASVDQYDCVDILRLSTRV